MLDQLSPCILPTSLDNFFEFTSRSPAHKLSGQHAAAGAPHLPAATSLVQPGMLRHPFAPTQMVTTCCFVVQKMKETMINRQGYHGQTLRCCSIHNVYVSLLHFLRAALQDRKSFGLSFLRASRSFVTVVMHACLL
jgi:beta-lactamase class D